MPIIWVNFFDRLEDEKNLGRKYKRHERQDFFDAYKERFPDLFFQKDRLLKVFLKGFKAGFGEKRIVSMYAGDHAQENNTVKATPKIRTHEEIEAEVLKLSEFAVIANQKFDEEKTRQRLIKENEEKKQECATC